MSGRRRPILGLSGMSRRRPNLTCNRNGELAEEYDHDRIRTTHWSAGRRVRRGTIMPLLALTIVAMVGFLALAIDLGMLAIAKTQAQQAADLAALTAARTLNGNASNNYNQTAATTNAQNILTYNSILGQAIQSSQLQLTYGSYDYNQTTQTFQANFPATTGRRKPRSRPRSPRTACRPRSARSSRRSSCRTSRPPPRRSTARATSPW